VGVVDRKKSASCKKIQGEETFSSFIYILNIFYDDFWFLKMNQKINKKII
jgi:hypothetical protein